MLRGVSSQQVSASYPEYTNYSALKTLKDYGANTFRIAMYVEQNDGYLEEPELNKKLLFSAIENSLAADLYTIVDWHVLRDENPNRNIEEAMDVLEEVARRYGDNPGIIYEICNEPNGDTTYEDIVCYVEQVIPIIRKHAPNSLILVGTPNFCTSLSEAIEDPISTRILCIPIIIMPEFRIVSLRWRKLKEDLKVACQYSLVNGDWTAMILRNSIGKKPVTF